MVRSEACVVTLLAGGSRLRKPGGDLSADGIATDLRRTVDPRLAQALDKLPLGIAIFDEGNRLEFSNDRYRLMYGLPPLPAGTGMQQVLEMSVAVGNYPGRLASELWDERRAFVERRASGTMLQHLGDGRLISIGHEPLSDGGWIATFEDITDRRRAEMELKFTAEHDLLTLLPNRVLFTRRLAESLSGMDRGGCASLLYLDLDGFKPVNDSLGHAAGDALLQQLGERLTGALRGSDVAARLGGDEFAVLLPGAGLEAASALADRLVSLLSSPYDLGGAAPPSIGVSIGIACAPIHGRTGDELMNRADEALYAAKRTARGRACVAGTLRAGPVNAPAVPGMPQASPCERTLEAELRQAIEEHRLTLNFQPIVSCATGDAIAYEALVRWTDPVRGAVPPDVFVPIAEQCGLIGALTAWVLERACAEATRWTVQLNVNLSPLSLADPDLPDTVAAILDRHGLEPTRLVLEITETARLPDSPAVARSLDRLLELGVRLWLDDFGTGFANIGMLRTNAFSAVKIDRSFLADDSPGGASLLRNMVAFARACALDVVVEGVERPAQVSQLRSIGCDLLQGFLIGMPADAGSFPFLRAQPVETSGGVVLGLFRGGLDCAAVEVGPDGMTGGDSGEA